MIENEYNNIKKKQDNCQVKISCYERKRQRNDDRTF